MTVWFTADTHFGHGNVIKHCNRPFASVDEMDREMIARWNERVRPSDTVYHLGDFCWGDALDGISYLEKLNGEVRLIRGNHDRNGVVLLHRWKATPTMMEISVDGHHITLCHYGMRVWNQSHRGSLHFYGHSHGSLPGTNQSCDVGVDCWDYRPVSLPEIMKRMQGLPQYVGDENHEQMLRAAGLV
jgi:calcineurin-like phosphoesterase family protein